MRLPSLRRLSALSMAGRARTYSRWEFKRSALVASSVVYREATRPVSSGWSVPPPKSSIALERMQLHRLAGVSVAPPRSSTAPQALGLHTPPPQAFGSKSPRRWPKLLQIWSNSPDVRRTRAFFCRCLSKLARHAPKLAENAPTFVEASKIGVEMAQHWPKPNPLRSKRVQIQLNPCPDSFETTPKLVQSRPNLGLVKSPEQVSTRQIATAMTSGR